MGERLRAAALLVVAFLVVGIISPPYARGSWDEVDFEGSGWGHGVGMSQWGAQAMATQGKSYKQILSHYYQGTSRATLSQSTSLWVNLERNFDSKTLFVKNTGSTTGAYVQLSGGIGSSTAMPGGNMAISRLGASGCRIVINNPEQAPLTLEDAAACSVDLSWYDWHNAAASPSTLIEIGGCTNPDWNAPGGTVWRPCQYARGMMHLRYGPGGLDLSAEMLIDDYVMGISEIPPSWRPEALKAQAVAARSYAEARRIERGNPASNSCDGWCHVRDTTADQRYVGWGHSNVANWVAATKTTARQVLKHPDSSIKQDPDSSSGVITAYYSSSTGGATEFGHEVGFSRDPVEWLTSVSDKWAVDGTVPNPNASWRVTWSPGNIAAAVGLDQLTAISVTKRRPGSNSAAEVSFKGIKNGSALDIRRTGKWTRQTFNLKSEYFDVSFRLPGEEMFFYRTNGEFRYEDVNPDGSLNPPILTGSGYTKNWSAITAVDLDGDAQDEIFFYRDDGLFRYYNINTNATIGSPILASSGYTKGWDSITAVDLDGDGQDEMFFYRDDGLFRYYDIKSNGEVGRPILAGDGYTKNWSAITAVDLDGDGQDEMFFYRADGLYRYYNINPNGTIGNPINQGDTYFHDWSSVTSINLDGH